MSRASAQGDFGRLAMAGWPLDDIRGEIAAIVCLVPVLLTAVAWNGFPIVYYDTGAYVLEGLGGHFLIERSPVYSLFLRFAGAGASLWFVVAIQVLAVAFTMTECARAVAPKMPLGVLVAIGVVLVLATGLPWYVGQIEPDCFTALVVLAIYLLAFHRPTLGVVRAIALCLICAFGVAAHPSHLLLAGFFVLLLAAMRLLAPAAWPKPRIAAGVVVCALGLALTVAANFSFTGRIFVSRAGSSFVFARMLQDGIVMRLLEDTCPKSGYRLCAYRDALPATADGWLWTPKSPFFALGHFEGTAAESQRIVEDALLRYPLLQTQVAIRDAATQFARFRTGDQIEPQEWVLYPVLAHYLRRQMPAYMAARQQQGEIDFRWISFVDVAVGWLSLAGLFVTLAYMTRTARREQATFLACILAALLGNAIICGVLSGPHDRYQSRLIWTAPFALMLLAPVARRRT